jgi:hypothetical protein
LGAAAWAPQLGRRSLGAAAWAPQLGRRSLAAAAWPPQLGRMSAMTKAFIQVIQPIKLYRFCFDVGGGRYTPFFCSAIG